MKSLRSMLMSFAIVTMVLAPPSANAADLDDPPDRHASNPIAAVFNGVTCAVVTIVTLPILILTGEQTQCRWY